MKLSHAWLLCAVLSGTAAAQEAAVPTLRAFTNLIQIPTLVLDYRGYPVAESTHPRFLVSLDGGKAVPATHVRLEGEDPLSLAILMDASGPQNALLHQLARTLAAQVPGGLRPQDRVWIYAVDCTLAQSLADAAPDAASLRSGVETALRTPGLHGEKGRGCGDRRQLRRAMLEIAETLRQSPGRRVLLAISDGGQDASVESWTEVRTEMRNSGTTVFGLAAVAERLGSNTSLDGLEALSTMCAGSGGLLEIADDTKLKDKLARMLFLLRARYIVQFHRSDELAEGYHPLVIQVAGEAYLIHPSGASFPLADPKLKTDPNVVSGRGLGP